MRTKILAALLVFVAAGLTTSATAQTSEGGSVDVSVNSVTAVDLSPNSLAYSNDPGTIATTETTNGYEGVEIENVGSVNITDIYFTTTAPSDRPYGSGVAAQYDAGNFVQIRPSGENSGTNAESDYHYVSHKSFNESNTLSYFTEPSGVGTVRYGRFRAANESFFWAVTNAEDQSSANMCDGNGDSDLLVGTTPHTPTQTGSVDFSSSSNYDNYTVSSQGNDNYGRVDNVDLNTYEGTKTISMLTWCGSDAQASSDNSTHVIGTRWNPETREDGASGQYTTTGGSLDKILENGGTDANELQPGEHFTVLTRASIPNAVANGNVGQGTLTVKVSVTDD